MVRQRVLSNCDKVLVPFYDLAVVVLHLFICVSVCALERMCMREYVRMIMSILVCLQMPQST